MTVFKFIGHHACSKDGGFDHVLQNAPFESRHDPEGKNNEEGKKSNKFLGTGYYFWDENLETAKWWGGKSYKDGFFVVQCNLIIPTLELLDLLANRKHMMKFLLLAQELHIAHKNKFLTVADTIEMLKELHEEDESKKTFPYQAVRAIDHRTTQRKKEELGKTPNALRFHRETSSFINLSPSIILCIFKKSLIEPNSTKVVFRNI
jgi:hypothetical protein